MDNYIVIILFGVGVLLGCIALYMFHKYVAPWLADRCEQIRQQLGDEEYYMLVERIKTFMAMAEQQVGPGNGKAKSTLVIEWITKLFPGIDKAYVQALIDGFMKPLEREGIINAK